MDKLLSAAVRRALADPSDPRARPLVSRLRERTGQTEAVNFCLLSGDLRSSCVFKRERAAKDLIRHGAESIPFLLAELKTGDWMTRAWSAYALRKIGILVPGLIEALAALDEGEETCDEVKKALFALQRS